MQWQEYLTQHEADFEARLLDFLRIPSISSLPEHAADVRKAGEWVMTQVRAAGMEHVEMMETGGHPVVYADWLHAPGKPTVMIYGHFDTQPVDPLELWDSPPFEPVVKDGRVYARGASDDKGNMLAPVIALEALLKTTGALPVNVKCFFEGQEEIGSPTLPDFIAANKEKFACDFVISADGGQW
ncbi:MAG: M20/M25/M40 family metallo-hydrolase, partial [Caldilineaceae bacterium]|nr:M20/M25/M40 family metallo-hydrolase [Caldilineaceae bacterium]